MQESDAPPAGPAPGLLIDQLIAGRPAPRQGGLQIGHAVADVVDAGPAFRKELRHGTLGIARLEQLDVDVAEMQADDRGAIGGFGPSRSESQDVSIKGECLCDAGDCDADVSQRRVHRKSNYPLSREREGLWK